MSGHSHFATIKRQKGLKDAARGNVFSKLARAITIAAKNGPDPVSNYKLRIEMDRAKAANMPKENIERAVARASAGGEVLDEVSYEGFAPGGIAVIVSAATDNKNRTAQEIKNLFERGGGSLAGPGAVSYNFELKGLIVVNKSANAEDDILKLIDLGAEDVDETIDGIEVYVAPDKLTEMRDKLVSAGFTVTSAELYQRPKSLVTISDPQAAKRALSFLEALEEQDDVQKVFANLDIPQEVFDQIKS